MGCSHYRRWSCRWPDRPQARSIRVEDVSDRQAVLLVNDTQPAAKEGAWLWVGPPLSADAPSLQWLHEIDDSFRVYMFKIVLEDGREISLCRAIYYSNFLKANVLKQLEAEDKK